MRASYTHIFNSNIIQFGDWLTTQCNKLYTLSAIHTHQGQEQGQGAL
jgi:hypothetical protein